MSKRMRNALMLFAVSLFLIGCDEKSGYGENGGYGENNSLASNVKTPLSEAQIYSKLKSSIVKVKCYDLSKTKVLSQGTGFFIDSKGTFLTNYHVIDKSYYVSITTSSGSEKWVSTINYYDYTTSDYAICKIDSFNSTSVTFSNSYKNGDSVYSLGFPNNSTSLKHSQGKIINKEITANGKKYIENDASANHGSSGGVLCDRYGNVIGITTCELASNYGAIPYSSFSSNLSSKKTNKSPLEAFHNVRKVSLSTLGIGTYFDYGYSVQSIGTGSMTSFSYYLRFKSAYVNKVVLDTNYLYISIRFSADYTYSLTSSSTQTNKFTANQYESVYLYSSDLSSGKSGTASVYYSASKIIKVDNPQMKFFSTSGRFLVVG